MEVGWTAKGPAPTSFCYDSGASGHGKDLSPSQVVDLVALAFPDALAPALPMCMPLLQLLPCRRHQRCPHPGTTAAADKLVDIRLGHAKAVENTIAMLKDGGPLAAVHSKFYQAERDNENNFVYKVLAFRSPNLLDFHEDHVSLEAPSKIQLKPLAEEMQAIN
ncbi:hypothetical protein Taro_022242 [Colocasia esculenta]|uniref:Uncharacterized protein n=1 Tax=Colocasia esculenta TaxID=4460 RepID=A0A843V3C1_COLES|nr:hypothetical protein [Colocasia esculenta]